MNKKTIENTKFVGNVIFRRNKFVGNVFLDTISWKRLKEYSSIELRKYEKSYFWFAESGFLRIFAQKVR